MSEVFVRREWSHATLSYVSPHFPTTKMSSLIKLKIPFVSLENSTDVSSKQPLSNLSCICFQQNSEVTSGKRQKSALYSCFFLFLLLRPRHPRVELFHLFPSALEIKFWCRWLSTCKNTSRKTTNWAYSSPFPLKHQSLLEKKNETH